MAELHIACEFSKTPAGRSIKVHGDHSGEAFRDNLLWPKLKEAIEFDDLLEVIFDGTAGYPASFLDEAFAGLIRKKYCSQIQIERCLKILALSPSYEVYKKQIRRYIDDAVRFQKKR